MRPLHKEFVNVRSRLETFKLFPVTYIDKEVLACAGFFFAPNEAIGETDLCVCYNCGIKLFRWELKDDPWTEHLKYNKECEYIQKHFDSRPNIHQLSLISSSSSLHPPPYEEIYGNQSNAMRHAQNNPHIPPQSVQVPSSPFPRHVIGHINETPPGARNLSKMPESNAPQYNNAELSSYQRETKERSYVFLTKSHDRNFNKMPESNAPKYNNEELGSYQRETKENSYVFLAKPHVQPTYNKLQPGPNLNIGTQFNAQNQERITVGPQSKPYTFPQFPMNQFTPSPLSTVQSPRSRSPPPFTILPPRNYSLQMYPTRPEYNISPSPINDYSPRPRQHYSPPPAYGNRYSRPERYQIPPQSPHFSGYAPVYPNGISHLPSTGNPQLVPNRPSSDVQYGNYDFRKYPSLFHARNPNS